MTISILTLFPEFFKSPIETSILKRAQESNRITFNIINIRDFSTDKHRTTDDKQFGGGAGMVMKIEPIDRALQSLAIGSKSEREPKTKVLLTSAKGKLFSQPLAKVYAQLSHLVIICGHYEGVDERVAQYLVDEEIRIGNYVLTGGETAALVMGEAITRLIPGVLGNEASLIGESHEEIGVSGVPVYTRPETYNQWSVPEVLLGGNHSKIEEWRLRHRKQLD